MTRGLRQLNTAQANGTVVLALHSLGLRGLSWQGVADATNNDHPFFVFDQLGHGLQAEKAPENFQSFVEDAQSALSDLQTDQVHLVGHSLGGAVAAYLTAKTRSPRIASLSMIATPFIGSDVFATRAHAVDDGGMAQVCAETIERWFDREAPDGAAHAARTALCDMQPEGFDACWNALAGFPGYAALPKKPIPLRVCSFAKDRSTPPQIGAQISEELHETFQVHDHHIIDGAGHMGVLTHPGEVATFLSEHWRASLTNRYVGDPL